MQKYFENLFGKIKSVTDVSWDKTTDTERRVQDTAFFEEKGIIRKEKFFKGRPIIGRDRRINGGIYLGASEREAIVVDDKKDVALDRVYQELLHRRSEAMRRGEPFKKGILYEVWRLVRQVMPFDEKKVDEIVQSLPEPDTKIYLSSFIGGGVCRHQALLAAYLLERLADEKHVHGRVSVDRNAVKNEGGHAWARYENSAGEVVILDPAQEYFGKLSDMTARENRWFYERPEDINPKLKKLLRFKRVLLGK